jgi:histidine ammonia-lyase
MNAKGLPVILRGVIADLDMGAAPGVPSMSQKLVSDGAISQSELDGTRNNLKALVATLKNTPEEKIEALVAEYDEDLTAYLHKFNALGSGASIEKFRIAQIMSGLAVTIMAKADVKANADVKAKARGKV